MSTERVFEICPLAPRGDKLRWFLRIRCLYLAAMKNKKSWLKKPTQHINFITKQMLESTGNVRGVNESAFQTKTDMHFRGTFRLVKQLTMWYIVITKRKSKRKHSKRNPKWILKIQWSSKTQEKETNGKTSEKNLKWIASSRLLENESINRCTYRRVTSESVERED